MANDYLVEIHRFISEKIKAAQSGRADALTRGDPVTESLFNGQLRELYGLRAFMAERMDLITQKYY